jgi:ABC-type multidrug transport system fused ATPase/permease subunit
LTKDYKILSFKKPSIVRKLRFLLSPSQKKELAILAALLFLGMLFEMLGLGLLIPALSILLDADIAKSRPELKPLMDFFGYPSQLQLAIGGMLILIAVYFLKAVFLVFLTWRQSKFTFGLASGLSRKLFLGYLRQPYTFHLERNSAFLLRNIQHEIAQFITISSHSLVLATEFSMIMSIAVVLMFVEPIGAISVTVFLGVAALIFLRIIKRKLSIWGKDRQFHGGQTNKHLMQGLSGVKDLKIFGRENVFLNAFVQHNKVLEGIDVKMNTVSLIPRFYLELLAVIGLAGLIVMMVLQHKPLDTLLPTLGVFVVSAFRMIPSVNRIIDSLQRIRFAIPVVNLLYEEFKLIEDIETQTLSGRIMAFSKTLSINHVSFNYPNTSIQALNDLTLHIQKGESVGFIGLSGSGKSTLVDIILGLVKPVKGSVNMDGININENIRGWQDQIGYVPQTIYLTDDTLRRNVAFGIPDDQIDDAAVNMAIRAAQLDGFVDELPEKLETFIGERGVRLSGGQRQRIGIARALYHDPSILVLDEATSALDAVTEKGVMEAVEKLHGAKTLIIVAHRLSTLKNCNRIYKLDKGVLIDEGTPEEFIN